MANNNYTSTMGEIIKAENIKKEIPIYYSKHDINEVLDIERKSILTEVKKNIDDAIQSINIDGVSLANYYTKDQVNTVIRSIKTKSTPIELSVTEEGQRIFTIPDIDSPIANILIFNTTVRDDYIINGTSLTIDFDAPVGSRLTLVVISLEYNIV